MKFQKSYKKKNATAHVSSLGKEKNLHKQYLVYCCLYWWYVTTAGTVSRKEHPLDPTSIFTTEKLALGACFIPRPLILNLLNVKTG